MMPFFMVWCIIVGVGFFSSLHSAPASRLPTSDFRVEIATLDHDLNRIVHVVNSAYQKQIFNRVDGKRTSLTKLKGILLDPNNKLFLLISNNSNCIHGVVLLHQFEISMFSMDPDYQGKGLGRQLLNMAEEEAFKNHDQVLLKVIPLFQEKLIAYYQRHGYRFLGETESLSQEKLERIQPQYRKQVYAMVLRKNMDK